MNLLYYYSPKNNKRMTINKKLIAVFMGMYHEDGQPENIFNVPLGDDEYYTDDTFEDFHIDTNWNMLIPVLKKIDEILYESYADVTETCQDLYNQFSEIELIKSIVFTDNQLKFGTEINEVFDDVVLFINFYNVYLCSQS